MEVILDISFIDGIFMKDMKIIIVLEVRLFRNSFVMGTKEAFFFFLFFF